MIDRAKENWLRVKESEPGRRFRDRYRRHQENRRGRFDARTFLSIGGGILVVVGGLVAVPGPGPGWVITFLGLGLIAGEFLPVARLMDRAELKLRAWTRRVAGARPKPYTATKVSVCLAILLCIRAVGDGANYLFFGGSNPLPEVW